MENGQDSSPRRDRKLNVAHMPCPHCGHPNSPDAAFCSECGRPLPAGHPCPGCGFTGNPLRAAYCVQCGMLLRKRSFAPFFWLGGVALILAVVVIVLWQAGLLEAWIAGRAMPSAGGLPTLTAPSSMEKAATATKPAPTTLPPTHTPTPSSTRIPSLSEPDGCIVFDSYSNGNWDVYLVNPDGSGLTNLTRHPADDGDPVWSPDGQRIAFDSDRDGNWEIYLMNADGSGMTRLTNHSADDDSPAWLPNGQHVAFKSNRDGNWEIYVVRVDGSGLTNLTNHPAGDRLPTWSPDGRRVAFTSDRNDNWEIYVMNADGSEVTNLTNHSAEDWFPVWSPDGQRIVFHSYRDGDAEIYVMNADGSGVARLTHQAGDDWGPSWSPDGSWIVFTSDRDGDNEIYAMRADGSGIRRLTNNATRDTWPHWAPVACAGPMSGSSLTATPAPTPFCPLAVNPQLANAWDQGKLGCPTAQSSVTWSAWEPFQGGYMLWRNDTDGTHVLYLHDSGDRSAGYWEQMPEEWKWDLSNPDGIGMTPPAGLHEPKRGFGWLWRTHLGGPDSSLGWAEDEEKGFCATIQPFDAGLIFQSSTMPACEDDLYNWAIHPSFVPLLFALYEDGTWQRY
jgi:Tol biopolymer transport system component